MRGARVAPYNRGVQWQQFNSLVSLTAHELWRTHWVRLVSGVCVLAYAIAAFAASLAITESAAFRVTLYAAFVRLGLVAMSALLIIGNTVRDHDDRLLELMLSRPLDRRWWVGAKFATYVLAGAAAALLAGLPLLLWCPPAAALGWCLALGCELALVSAAALAAALSLAHVALAGLAVAGFYGLGRVIQAVVRLSQDPLFDPAAPTHRVIAALVRGLDYLLPDLARFADSAWLVYAAPSAAELGFVVGETLLYGSVLLLAGTLDFQRRNL